MAKQQTDPWKEWLQNRHKEQPSFQAPRIEYTSQFTAIDREIYGGRLLEISWPEVREWFELLGLRIATVCMVMVLLFLAELIAPVAYLECQALTANEEMRCEYRVGPRG